MATTGNVFAGAGATVDRAGSTLWTNPGNIVSDNATNATSTVPTDYLIASSFGFALPTGAVVRGITVRVEMSETGSGSSSYVIQLTSDTTPTLIGNASGTISITTGPVVSTTGSTTDLWGTTLTAAQVNSAGFGCALWSVDTINALQCDYITIAIEYTVVPNAWDPRQYFRKRRNSTNRRLKEVRLHETDQVAVPPSADRTLEVPFQTRNIRVRRALSIGWGDALTAQIPQVPQPVTAWIEPITNRRRDISRLNRPLPQADQITYPETPPAATVGSAVTFKTRIVPSRRQYSIGWTPGMVAPPVVVVEQPVSAWLPVLVIRRKETRRKLIVLSHKEIEQYTPPVIAWFEPPKAIKIEYRRVLQQLLFIKLPPAIGPPAWETKQRAPTFQDRRLLRTPQHNVYPETPSYAAWLAPKTNRIKRSRKLQKLGHPDLSPATQILPAFEPVGFHRRRETTRTLRLEQELNYYPATPPPAVPFPSWDGLTTNRVGQARKLQRLPELNVYPATPVVTTVEITAVTLVTQKRRKSRPGIFQTGGQLVEAHPEPSLLNFSPTGYHFRRDIKRTLQPQAPQITYPQTPPITMAAVTLVTNKRRKGRPGIIQTGGLLVEAHPEPSRFNFSPTGYHFRRATERRLQPADPQLLFPVTPPIPEAAFRSPVANRITRARKLQEQAPQITYPQTPSTPEQPEAAYRAAVVFRTSQVRRLQPQAPQPTYPPTPVVAEESRLGGDDKIRRKSPHRGHDKKRAQLKITEEQRLLADIRRMYRQLQGIEELAPQAEAILAPIVQRDESLEAYTAAKLKLIEARLESLASLGTEAEIALRLLYRELEEMRERDDELAVQAILALLL